MVVTTSSMLSLGSIAPAFNLINVVTGSNDSLQQLRGDKGTIVLFICNHCPFVIHVKEQLIAIARQYQQVGINTIAISANDIVNYPQDSPDKMQQLMAAWGNPFNAYLYDETQQVAKAYQAVCTPDIYFFDSNLACVYRGRLDGSTPKNAIPLTGEDLRKALDDYLAGKTIDERQIASLGCSIKWKVD